MKIVYCTDSLNHLGGIQKVTTVKASALANIEGNEVYIITAEGQGKSFFPLDNRVKNIDLDIRYYSDDWKSKWSLIKSTYIKRKEHKQKLKKILHEIKADIIISTGTSDKFYLPSVSPRESVVIREFHFCTQYRYLNAKGWFDLIKAYIGDIIDYKIKIKNYDQVYLLTKEDKQYWANNKKVSVIPNPNSFTPSAISSGKSKKVIAVGRYVAQKRFDNLLLIWKMVAHKYPDWTLEIWGEGEERTRLEDLIEKLDIGKSAFLKGYTADIEKQLQNSSVFVLTSDYEGFGLVIIEAMACGLVPVCFACQSGPTDIITDGEDGFLIPVKNLELFAEKLSLVMADEEQRIKMSQKAIERAHDFSIDKITKRWMNEFIRLKAMKQKQVSL
ncbi:glycosyltransferase family 4 protein [Bacteroides sp. 519]|uniref:glycosyltransferase family 4 protein n=1 Tax=Bacteroides sp. 519 TaxID=2302937 RepID=UPI0013D263F1|nr:glycosyltransferase family 4 protein [Bacteroides sp. 519]NDV60237.1 glycosyltransferase family 4 protein [Bacteroides sp. 519]